MFLDIEQFCRALVSNRPSVALVSWTSQAAKGSFVKRLGPTLRRERAGTIVSKLDCVNFDSASFEERISRALARRDAAECALLIHGIEPLATASARILNGYRERLARLRTAIVVIRENRRRDFMVACPDLMDWIGTLVTRAEDLAPPLTLREVNASLKRIEQRLGMSSKDFQAKWRTGQCESGDDYWMWNELIAIRDGMRAAPSP